MVFGLILVAIGIIALLVKLDVLSGSVWNYTWPVILIIIGLSFVFGRMFRRHWWFWGSPWRHWDRGKWNDRDKDKNE